MSEFTRGPVETRLAVNNCDIAIVANGRNIVAETFEDIREPNEHAKAECAANAELIKTAFNAATEIDSMGANVLEAIKLLPNILFHLRLIKSDDVILAAAAQENLSKFMQEIGFNND